MDSLPTELSGKPPPPAPATKWLALLLGNLYVSYENESISRSVVSSFATLWTVACQAPLSMEFFRQEYWSGLPFPSPEDLPNPGIEAGSPALQTDSLLSEPPGKPNSLILDLIKKINFLLILYLPALTFEVKYSHLFPQSSSVLCRTKSLLGGGVGQA